MPSLEKKGLNQDSASAVLDMLVKGHGKDLSEAQVQAIRDQIKVIMNGYETVLRAETDKSRSLSLEQDKPKVEVAAAQILLGDLRYAEKISPKTLNDLGAGVAEELRNYSNVNEKNKELNKVNRIKSFFTSSIAAPQATQDAPAPTSQRRKSI